MAKATPVKQNIPKLVTAYARALHIAPRKMRLVTNMVKGNYALDALTQLSHLNKKGAPMVVKLLKSAIANARHNFQLEPEALYIKSITCDQGKEMKRYFPRARGSAFVIRRKMSHVNVILEEKQRKGGKLENSRVEMFKKLTKKRESQDEKPKAPAAESTEMAEQKALPKEAVPKSSEKIKENKIQNKRRLFNRKSGV
jgi:large subunit ribosomal protein L22